MITSGQPALNPRLVKEADALSDAGFEVVVLFGYWNQWGSDFTKELLRTKRWAAVETGGNPITNSSTYFISRLIFAIAKWIIKLLGPISYFSELATSRSSYFLIREAKKHRADIYIGHNLAALPAVVKASKKHHAKCGFDAEDFHRNETDNSTTSLKYKLTKYIEDKYMAFTDYVTASSPQITAAYKQLYPVIDPVTILNVFPKAGSFITRNKNLTTPIKIVWFSQTIGKNRGIDDMLLALKLLGSDNFELHLLGNVSEYIKNDFADIAGNASKHLYFHNPIAPDNIVDFISQFDIGLASEPGFSLNNDLALSNKIFTYLQAGLAIVASDTQAQQSFLDEYNFVGALYPKKNHQLLVDILSEYNQNRDKLFNTQQASFKLGFEQLNWGNESVKFLNLVNTTLSH